MEEDATKAEITPPSPPPPTPLSLSLCGGVRAGVGGGRSGDSLSQNRSHSSTGLRLGLVLDPAAKQSLVTTVLAMITF